MENKKRTQILLINDMAGYGKVALSVMIPVLSHLKYETFNLPTALVSNTLDYGQFDILETTDYMNHTLQIWKNLMFSFDAICTGFIVSETQSSLVYEYCKEQQKTGTMIFVDPIMGDNGKRYNGVTDDAVTYMKRLCSIADVIIPILLPLFETFMPLDALIASFAEFIPFIHTKLDVVLWNAIPFNLLKGLGIALVTLVVYPKLTPVLRGTNKGR